MMFHDMYSAVRSPPRFAPKLYTEWKASGFRYLGESSVLRLAKNSTSKPFHSVESALGNRGQLFLAWF